MTPEQFDCCTRSRSGAATIAARLVLVDGKTNAEAIAETGVTKQALSNALKRYRATDKAIRDAYCADKR